MILQQSNMHLTQIILTIIVVQVSQAYDIGYNLTILHTNDVHDRMKQFNARGESCSNEDKLNGQCYGGVSRRATMINGIRTTVRGNVLLLDAGDQFQGTNWFFLYEGRSTSYFMNKLGYDVQVS